MLWSACLLAVVGMGECAPPRLDFVPPGVEADSSARLQQRRSSKKSFFPSPATVCGSAKIAARRETVRTRVGAFSVRVVSAPPGSYRIKVGLARGKVGATQALAQIAQAHRAVAAINGSFFDAYSKRAVRNPYGTLITDGRVVHIADHPTLIGSWYNGRSAIGKARFGIVGSLDGSAEYPNNWYSYGLNDLPTNGTWAALYTPRWAGGRSPADGKQVVVSNGRVVSTARGPHAIPRDGFILHLRGKEEYLARRFTTGRKCAFRVVVKAANPGLDWESADEALGCGPMLVRDGRVSVDPRSEGFRDPKVLSGSGARSAAGLTRDGGLLLATCRSATIEQWAEVMKALGAKDAMNLDGGASSGLWLRGDYLTTPGRALSNCLLLLSV